MKGPTISFVLAISFFNVLAQSTVEKISFPPPDVASLVKTIEKPVSLYNGQASVNIPLYTVRDGTAEIPLSISYNTSGFKVAEEAGLIGLGWNISPGGLITHEIVGEEDIESNIKQAYGDPGYYLGDPNFFNGYYLPVEGYARKEFGMTVELYETMNPGFVNRFFEHADKYTPDKYTFSFGQYSGGFYVDQYNDSIYQLKEDPKILFEKTAINGKKGFKATVPDGTTFFFNGVTGESRVAGSGTTYPVSKTYYLSEVVLPDGHVIIYTYTKVGNALNCFSQSERIESSNNHYVNSSTSTASEYDVVILSSISTSNTGIFFDYTTREDIEGEAKKLERIRILNKQTSEERSIDFFTSYFTSSTAGNFFGLPLTSYDIKRLKLDSVRGTDMTIHKFNYNSTILPAKRSYAIDYWGYFNGKTDNETLHPKMSYIGFLGATSFGDYGACRAVSENHAQACMLEKIVYPTKGETQLYYELNTFENHKIPSIADLQTVGLMGGNPPTVIVSDQNTTPQTTNYAFTIQQDKIVRISGKINAGRGTPEDIEDASISLLKFGPGGVTTMFTWQYSTANSGVFNFMGTLIPGNYAITANLPDHLGDQTIPDYVDPTVLHAISQAFLYLTPDGFLSVSEGAGLRVSKIINRPNDVSVAVGREFVYSNGTLMSPLKFYQNKPFHVAKGYTGPDGATCYNESQEMGYVQSSNSLLPISYSAMGAFVGYNKVREYAIHVTDATTRNGYVEYNYINRLPQSHPFSEEIKPVDNGVLLSEQYFNNDNVIVKQIDYVSNRIVKHRFFGMSYDDIWRGPWGTNCGLYNLGIWYDRFSIVFYPLVTYQIHIQKKTEQQQGVSVETNYIYNDNASVVWEQHVAGPVITEVFTDFYDDQTSSSYIERFIKNHKPQQKRTYKNGSIIRKDSFIFLKTDESTYYLNNIKIPHINLTNYKGYPTGGVDFIETNYLYNSGKLVEILSSNSIPTVYLWAYKGTRPVAEINGMSLSQLTPLLNAAGVVSNDILISGYDNSDTGLRSKLKALQNLLPSSGQMTFYTYDIHKGIISSSDVNGQTTFFNYDVQGRLNTLKDHDGNIIKNHIYHYREQ